MAAGASVVAPGVAQAAPQTYTVGTNANTSSAGQSTCGTAGNTTCSLREAISLANANTPDNDTILFNSNLTGSTIQLSSGALEITDGVSIDAGSTGARVDGGADDRVFYVNPTTEYDAVSVAGLTMRNGIGTPTGQDNGGVIDNETANLTISSSVISDGYTTDGGAGVYSREGELTIDQSTISGNYAGFGAGIFAYSGDVTITDSTVSGNYTHPGDPGYDQMGGGLFLGPSASTSVDRSTFFDNTANYGGGVFARSGTGSVTIENSTISGNHALTHGGGGVWFAGTRDVTVNAATVTGNDAGTYGGGLATTTIAADPVVENSIVTGNTATGEPASSDLYSYTGTFDYFDTAFSLIGVPGGYVNETVTGSNLTGVDPKLAALANNGGSTETQAPLCDSPVIDAGKSFDGGEDQRGLTRPVELADFPNAAGGDGSDIGAVELQTSPGTVCTPPPSGGSPTPVTPATPKKKCKKKHKRVAESAKKKCKKKKKS
jgi:CSLREA domain-containing protein